MYQKFRLVDDSLFTHHRKIEKKSEWQNSDQYKNLLGLWNTQNRWTVAEVSEKWRYEWAKFVNIIHLLSKLLNETYYNKQQSNNCWKQIVFYEEGYNKSIFFSWRTNKFHSEQIIFESTCIFVQYRWTKTYHTFWKLHIKSVVTGYVMCININVLLWHDVIKQLILFVHFTAILGSVLHIRSFDIEYKEVVNNFLWLQRLTSYSLDIN